MLIVKPVSYTKSPVSYLKCLVLLFDWTLTDIVGHSILWTPYRLYDEYHTAVHHYKLFLNWQLVDNLIRFCFSYFHSFVFWKSRTDLKYVTQSLDSSFFQLLEGFQNINWSRLIKWLLNVALTSGTLFIVYVQKHWKLLISVCLCHYHFLSCHVL